jgi:hypothetical protein
MGICRENTARDGLCDYGYGTVFAIVNCPSLLICFAIFIVNYPIHETV